MKLTIYRDNNVSLSVQMFHDDGSFVNLTGCQIVMAFKTDQALANAGATIIKGTTAPYSGVAIPDAQHGIARVDIGTADTQSIADTITVFTDVLVIGPSGNAFTVGNLTTIEIKANITRR